MAEISYDTLQQQIERIRALVTQVLDSPAAPIPLALTATLFDFCIVAKGNTRFEQASETARSLASLLHSCGDRVPDKQERLQITVLIETLLQELAPGDAHAQLAVLRPLVSPVVPSAETANSRIALYLDDAVLQLMLRDLLIEAGFQPVVVNSLEALAATDETSAPAAVIADLGLCQLHPRSADVFTSLRKRLSPPPHLFCIADSNDIPARLAAVRLGATRCLAQPVDTARLLAALKGATARTPPRPYRVFMVEDDPFLGEVYREGLSEAGIDIEVINDPLLAPARIAEMQPDLVISDIFMPGCNGLELLALLRQDDALADTPILLLSSDPEVDRRLEALNLGADDFLTKPVDMSLLVAVVSGHAKRARMLKRSRSEYRRILQHVREIEPELARDLVDAADADIELDLLFPEVINMDDFVVRKAKGGKGKS